MSWLFSQVLVEEYSVANSWDGAPSAPLSVMPTPHKFSRNDKTIEPCRLSRFGLTCAVLTVSRGEALLMWYLAGFRARTFLFKAEAPASRGLDQAFGKKWQESSVRFDPLMCGWKTPQCSLPEVLPWSSVTLPKWGMTRNGVVYQRLNAARPISVTGSGCWPTPTASMAKGSSPKSLKRRCGRDRTRDRLDHAVMASDGGPLNPEWVEWLMGWPSGWTGLKPLEMGRYQEWWQVHAKF